VPQLCKNLYGQIFDDKKNSLVNKAIFVEDLSNGITSIIKELKINKPLTLDLQHKNKSPKATKKYIEVYDEIMIKKVQKKCEWELDTFGYSFGNRRNDKIKEISNITSK
jgi:hypothetical protein